jgi:hypothetical protein
MSSSRTLTVQEAFSEPARGKTGLSKAYIKDHLGNYPVYSAATTGPLGFIDSWSLEGPALSWTLNGYAGNMAVLKGRYSITADRAVVKPRVEGLNLDFCRIVLQAKFRDAARGRRVDGKNNEYTKLPPELVRSIEFEVPVRADGSIDTQAQAAFVARFDRIDALQHRARELVRLLATAIPKPATPGGVSRPVELLDENIFMFINKQTSWGKKDWHSLATGNEADHPVYSAAKGPVAYVAVTTPKLIEASQEFKVVSFAVDGDSGAGGNLVIHSRPFYISTNRACFASKEPRVDMEYVFHALSSMKADYGFSYSYKAYKGHLKDVTIEFPIDEDGQLDLGAQQLMSATRQELIDLRDRTTSILGRVINAKVLSDSYAP